MKSILNPTPIILHDDERQPCEIWTRVMGYHRPVSEFNPGKKSEHKERAHFKEARIRLASPNGTREPAHAG